MDSETRDLLIDSVGRGVSIRGKCNRQEMVTLDATMQEHGMMYPIVVSPSAENAGRFDLIDGGRRLWISNRRGAKTIRAIVLDKPQSEGEAIEKAFIANTQREALNPVDQARVYQRYQEVTGGTLSQVAACLKKSPAEVSKGIAILSLPSAILDQIASGKICPDSAYFLTRVADEAERPRLAEQLAAGTLTRDAISELVKDPLEKRGRRQSHSASSKVVVPLRDGRSVRIAGSSLDLDAVISCAEELLVLARRARKQGLELPGFVKLLRANSKSSNDDKQAPSNGEAEVHA